uniref:Uncharacterized protein n=1 Tax=Salix viminalis TaxID=40686 RepID=A0A6N2MUB5_SALVM
MPHNNQLCFYHRNPCGIDTSFPPNRDPENEMDGHNPTGDTCTVQSAYALKSRIRGLKKWSRWRLPHVN